MTDREGALRRAEKLIRQNRLAAAIKEYRQLVDAQPDDWNTANTLGDLYVRAGKIDQALTQYGRIADNFGVQGFLPKALAVYKKMLKVQPENEHAALRSADISVRQGLIGEARDYLSGVASRRRARGDRRGEAEIAVRIGELEPANLEARIRAARTTAELGQLLDAARQLLAVAREHELRGDRTRATALVEEAGRLLPIGDREADPPVLLLRAEVELKNSRYESARGHLRRVLGRGAGLRAEVLQLATTVAPDVNAEFHCLEVVATDAAAREEWEVAVETLQEFVRRRPRHIPALLKLVEIATDGNLEGPRLEIQRLLADAYLASGAGPQARVIAEDLALRDPGDRANIERLRRALILENESDPDRVIAECLSRPSPFGAGALASPAAFSPARSNGSDTTGVARPAAHQHASDPQFELSANAIDVIAILTGSDRTAGASIIPVDQVEVVGVDPGGTSASLDTEPGPHRGGEMPHKPKDRGDLDGVFEDFRNEVTRQDSTAVAEQHFKLGLTYREMGMKGEAIQALETAARSPKFRFDAASLIGRLHKEQGKLDQAIEWFERAAEAPAASVEDGRALLYELGRTLEASQEVARALAVYLELQADAADYRDLPQRIDRLSKLQARG